MNKSRLLLVALVLGGCNNGNGPEIAEPIDRYQFVATATSNGEKCIKDTLTGLTWEAKSDALGLHDWRNTYSWYNPTQAHSELDYRGTEDGGSCNGSRCDTWDVVEFINTEQYCGFEDWRIPTKDELYSINNLAKTKTPPTIDLDFFPLTHSAEYWTVNDYSFQPDSAWAWSFAYGHDRVDWKKAAKFVRLVRGQATNLEEVKE